MLPVKNALCIFILVVIAAQVCLAHELRDVHVVQLPSIGGHGYAVVVHEQGDLYQEWLSGHLAWRSRSLNATLLRTIDEIGSASIRLEVVDMVETAAWVPPNSQAATLPTYFVFREENKLQNYQALMDKFKSHCDQGNFSDDKLIYGLIALRCNGKIFVFRNAIGRPAAEFDLSTALPLAGIALPNKISQSRQMMTDWDAIDFSVSEDGGSIFIYNSAYRAANSTRPTWEAMKIGEILRIDLQKTAPEKFFVSLEDGEKIQTVNAKNEIIVLTAVQKLHGPTKVQFLTSRSSYMDPSTLRANFEFLPEGDGFIHFNVRTEGGRQPTKLLIMCYFNYKKQSALGYSVELPKDPSFKVGQTLVATSSQCGY